MGKPISAVDNRKPVKDLTLAVTLAFFVAAVPAVLLMVLTKAGILYLHWRNPLFQAFLLGGSSALSAVIGYMLHREARITSHPAIQTLSIGFTCLSSLLLVEAYLRNPVYVDWLRILFNIWTSLFAGATVLMIAWRAAYRACRNLLACSALNFCAGGLLLFFACLSVSLFYLRIASPDPYALTRIRQWSALCALCVIGAGLLLAVWLYLRRGAAVLLSFALAAFLHDLALISVLLGDPSSLLWWYGHSMDFVCFFLVAYGILEASRLQEHERAEQAVRDSEARYRLLFESSPHPLWVYDLESLAFLAVNDAAIQKYGYSRSEFLALTIRDIRPPEDVPALLHEAHQERNTLDSPGLWRHRKKDGTIIHVEITSHQLLFEGRLAKLVLAHDVSESKKLEQQLRQAQKMEAVGRLSGGVAHDFNNLLGVIIGYSEVLQDRLPTGEPHRRHVEEIKKAGQRAASLTRQLLAFSRQQVLEPKVLDLNAIVLDVERMLRRLIGEDIELTTSVDPDLGRVKADQGQIEQVIMNLAVNARDAMPEGGKLTLETANVELGEDYADHHPLVAPGPYVLLAVTDNGMGMDAETQAHIFEPFFTTKEPGKGTGLGLATVYGVIKQSGGYIWVYSELGQGTTFKIYLPRVDAPVQTAPHSVAPAKSLQGSETILLVEDEESLRTLTLGLLQRHGYAVLAASSGAQALEIARRHQGRIHLLLTDVVMPGISGRALAEHLLALHPGIKVLYMSGYTKFAISHHGVLEEGPSLLQKPFTRDALLGKMREVLESTSVSSHSTLTR